MITRRLPNTPATPQLTGGEDRPAAKCATDKGRELVDAVYARGHQGTHARRHLLILCSECPVREFCWADPEWRDALKAAS